jgi:hypothetical protein
MMLLRILYMKHPTLHSMPEDTMSKKQSSRRDAASSAATTPSAARLPLRVPPSCRVVPVQPGTVFGFIGAEAFRPRSGVVPAKPEEYSRSYVIGGQKASRPPKRAAPRSSKPHRP